MITSKKIVCYGQIELFSMNGDSFGLMSFLNVSFIGIMRFSINEISLCQFFLDYEH